MRPVPVGDFLLGDGTLAFLGGPCVLEERERVLHIAASLRDLCAGLGLPYVFKASFDKANRTRLASHRGPGLRDGLALLAEVRALGVPVTTDVHEPHQAAAVAEVCDLLQVPAFLCRQTDLLQACAATGRPVNVKKGPFLAPDQVGAVVEKLDGAAGVLLTERGTTFGHGDLVVDYRGLVAMRRHAPVVFDCTHATQRPGVLGDRSGGDRTLAAPLARAAAAVGIDALFAEVHDDPAVARSDAATQLPLDQAEGLLRQVLAVHEAVAG